MRKILKQLNEEVGVKGSMVVGAEGLVVMAELSDELNDDVVAAMASSTVSSTRKSLSLLGKGVDFTRFILVASQGRIVVVNTEPACLLVITDKNINIDYTLLAIDGAAQRLKKVWKI